MAADKRKGRPQEHDRPAVLAAAREVAGRRGYEHLRFADVASASGVPVSSLQYAFGTREALVREVLRSGVGGELRRLDLAVAKPAEPWEKVLAFIKAGISTSESRRKEGWLLWIEFWRAGLRDDELRREASQLSRSWCQILVPAIKAGDSSGDFNLAGSSQDAASAIVGVVDGLGLQTEAGSSQMSVARARRIAILTARQILGVTSP